MMQQTLKTGNTVTKLDLYKILKANKKINISEAKYVKLLEKLVTEYRTEICKSHHFVTRKFGVIYLKGIKRNKVIDYSNTKKNLKLTYNFNFATDSIVYKITWFKGKYKWKNRKMYAFDSCRILARQLKTEILDKGKTPLLVYPNKYYEQI